MLKLPTYIVQNGYESGDSADFDEDECLLPPKTCNAGHQEDPKEKNSKRH